jgi:agmatine deiminase
MQRREFLKYSHLSVAALGVWQFERYFGQHFGQQEGLTAQDQQDPLPQHQDQESKSNMPDYSSTNVKLIKDSSPAKDGFWFPAEWKPHEATIMIMPSPQNWSGHGFSFDEVIEQWAEVANTLAEYEPVWMVVRPEDRKRANKFLDGEIELLEFPVNDGWARDTAPMFVINGKGERRAVGCTFNGWGDKFDGKHKQDALIKAHLSRAMEVPMYGVDLVSEGGALAFDGAGTILTTAQCLMNSNRNPGMSREAIDRMLNEAYGTQKVIWLDKGIEPDPITDGHIDGMAAFVDEGVVLLHACDDKSDPNFKICREAKKVLSAATDAKGRSFEIIDLPLHEGGHMNFYIGNGCVIVPIADDPDEDDIPLGILRDLFDDREVIGIGGHVLAEGGGGIHCITQQIPKL